MSTKLQQIQAKARELAQSGTFIGWRPIAFTLQFEEGFAEASIGSTATIPKKSWIACVEMHGRDFVQIALLRENRRPAFRALGYSPSRPYSNTALRLRPHERGYRPLIG